MAHPASRVLLLEEGSNLGLKRQCSNCHEVAFQDSFECVLGHLTCFTCGNSDKHCRFQVGSTNVCGKELQQDLLCRGISFSSPSTSTNSCDDGELFATPVPQLAQSDLPFMRCIFPGCGSNEKFSPFVLKTHLKEYHGVPLYQLRNAMLIHFVQDREKRLNVSGARYPSFVMECLSLHSMFFCTLGMEMIDGAPSLVIILRSFTHKFGDLKCPKFYGSITLIGNEGIIQEWTGMIPKLTTTEAEVVKELACLIVPNPERAILQFQYVKINLMPVPEVSKSHMARRPRKNYWKNWSHTDA